MASKYSFLCVAQVEFYVDCIRFYFGVVFSSPECRIHQVRALHKVHVYKWFWWCQSLTKRLTEGVLRQNPTKRLTAFSLFLSTSEPHEEVDGGRSSSEPQKEVDGLIGPQVYRNICFSIKGCRIHRDQCQVP